MNITTAFSAILVVWIVQTTGVAGLQCYQCSATSADSPCVNDIDQLIDAKTNGGVFSKNCTVERNQRFCLLERSDSKGHLTTFIRDCSDGETFSFDSIKRLQDIAPTNQTTCSTFGTSGTVVCISLCFTDFCNGPQSSSATSQASRCSTMLFMYAFMVGLSRVH